MPVIPLTALKKFSFRLRNLNPPTEHRVSLDDRLYVWWVSEGSAAILRVRWRAQDGEGEIILGGDDIILSPSAEQNFRMYPVPDGFLLSASVHVQESTDPGGEVWVELGLARLELTNPVVTGVLAQGYVERAHAVGWPRGGLASAYDVEGAIRDRSIANPGAGNEWSWTVPNVMQVEITSLSYWFTSAAGGGNRISRLIADGPLGTVMYAVPSVVQAGGLTYVYAWSHYGDPGGLVGNILLANLPRPLVLGPGWTLRSSTVALAAGDSYILIRIAYRRWLVPS